MKFPLACVLPAALAFATLGAQSSARADAAQDFADQHTSDVVKLSTVLIADPAVVKTFAAPIYTITIMVIDGDGGTQTSTQIAARSDDKLIPLSRPSSDGDCPVILKLLNPAFKLTSDADAKSLQDAFDLVYTILGDQDKATEKFKHAGNQWTFVRGNFIGKFMGFVLTTDASGTITNVKYVLGLN